MTKLWWNSKSIFKIILIIINIITSILIILKMFTNINNDLFLSITSRWFQINFNEQIEGRFPTLFVLKIE